MLDVVDGGIDISPNTSDMHDSDLDSCEVDTVVIDFEDQGSKSFEIQGQEQKKLFNSDEMAQSDQIRKDSADGNTKKIKLSTSPFSSTIYIQEVQTLPNLTTYLSTLDNIAVIPFSNLKGRGTNINSVVVKTPKKAKSYNWTALQDEQLTRAVEKYGLNNWAAVANEIEGRSIVECRNRYSKTAPPNHLDKFSFLEEKIIMNLFKEFGNRYDLIAQRLFHRTEAQVRRFLKDTKLIPE